jgi:hypothetical protein
LSHRLNVGIAKIAVCTFDAALHVHIFINFVDFVSNVNVESGQLLVVPHLAPQQ